MPIIPSIVSDLLHLPWAASQQHDTHEVRAPLTVHIVVLTHCLKIETLSQSGSAAAQTLSPSHMRPTLPVERDGDLRQGLPRRAELLTNVRRPNGSAAGKSANGRSADERRLMGDYRSVERVYEMHNSDPGSRAPPDAVAIKMPGNDESSYPHARNRWETVTSGGRHDHGYDGRTYGGDRRGSHRSGYSSTSQGRGRVNRQIPSIKPAGKHTRFSSSPPGRWPKRQRVFSPAETRQKTGVELVDLADDDDDDMLMKPAETPRVERTTKPASREPYSPPRSQLSTLDATASPPPLSRQIPTSTQPISAYAKISGQRPPQDSRTVRQQISRGSPEVVVSSMQQSRRNGRSISPLGMSAGSHTSRTQGSKHRLGALDRLNRQLPGSSPDQLQSEDTTESHYFAEAPRTSLAVKTRTAGEVQPKPALTKSRLPDLEISRLIESTKSHSAPLRKRSDAHERVQQQEDDVDTSLDELQNDQVTVHTTVTRLAGTGTKRATVAQAAPSPDLPTREDVVISPLPEASASGTAKREASPSLIQRSARRVKRTEAEIVALPLEFIHIYSKEREEDHIEMRLDQTDYTLKVYRDDTDHFYTVKPKQLLKIQYSRQEGAQSPIVQVIGPGSGLEQVGCFIGFPADAVLDAFLTAVNQVAKTVVSSIRSA